MKLDYRSKSNLTFWISHKYNSFWKVESWFLSCARALNSVWKTFYSTILFPLKSKQEIPLKFVHIMQTIFNPSKSNRKWCMSYCFERFNILNLVNRKMQTLYYNFLMQIKTVPWHIMQNNHDSLLLILIDLFSERLNYCSKCGTYKSWISNYCDCSFVWV